MFEKIMLDTSIPQIGIAFGLIIICMRFIENTCAVFLIKVMAYGMLIVVFQGYTNVYGNERMSMLNVFALMFCYIEFADNLGLFIKTIRETMRK